ncbi:hypothetical protein UFOVP204_141 [uncultured Caudovirales phage]|uniref:Uncharacterized protein n=1 Tax=uncultured Caudovirales phage TaxID=2100421 RepID=A0A6J7WJK0_9CAUD|nr:hypothetical protein UFOVP204_141 [uncultured Caudovirales phage]
MSDLSDVGFDYPLVTCYNTAMEKWYKYEFVCSYCDSLIEYTTKDLGTNLEQCPICPNNLTLMSVVDATIYPTQKKEETNMETLTPAQTMTLTWIENDVERTETYSESDIRAMYWNNKNLAQKQNEWYKKESQLRTLLEEVYADSNEQDTLSQIAEIFDVSLTKEIEVTAWVRVDMTIEVDMADGDYDIEDMVRNNLTIDSFGSEISVNDYDVDRVEEGAY